MSVWNILEKVYSKPAVFDLAIQLYNISGAKEKVSSDVKKAKRKRRRSDKIPYTNRKFENQRTTHKRLQNFYYTTIADRLTTVSWSNKSSNWCS